MISKDNNISEDSMARLQFATNILGSPQIEVKSDSISDGVAKGYRINFNYKARSQQEVFNLNGSPLIKRNEICTIVALPGTGKTHTADSICAGYIGAHNGIMVDMFGFSFPQVTPGKKLLNVDTERTKDDCRTSLDRIAKKLGGNIGHLLDDKNQFKNADYISLSDATSAKEVREAFEKEVASGQYEFVIIDGILDFVVSMNNEEDVSKCIRWLRSIAGKYDFSVIVTVHPNKGTESVAGHLGGMLYRFSRTVLIIRNNDSDINTKEISDQFAQGKLSHAPRGVCSYFRWDENLKMFASCDTPESVSNNATEDLKVIRSIMNQFAIQGKLKVSSSELRTRFEDETGKKAATFKKRMGDAVGVFIEKHGTTKDVFYSLINVH